MGTLFLFMSDTIEIQVAVLKTRLDKLENEVNDIKSLIKKLDKMEYTLDDVGNKVNKLVEKLDRDTVKDNKPFVMNWNVLVYGVVGLIVVILVLLGIDVKAFVAGLSK